MFFLEKKEVKRIGEV